MTKQEITDWISANYPDNQTGAITPKKLRDGFMQTLEFASGAMLAVVTVYVNGYGTLGNDSNDGMTWQTPFKTIGRVSELYNNKVYHLTVIVSDETFVTEDVTLIAPHVTLRVEGAGMLSFKSRTVSAPAEHFGNYGITMYGTHTVDLVAENAGFLMEGKAAKPAAVPETVYRKTQGGIILAGPVTTKWMNKRRSVNYFGNNAITIIEDNTVFITTEEWRNSTAINNPTTWGLDTLNVQEINIGWLLADSVAATAIFSTIQAGKTFLRQYHPLNSTDVNVWEGETVLSPANNKLWTKRGGTIRDAMGTVFS